MDILPPELWLAPLPHQYLGVTSRTFHSIQCSQDGYPPITLSSVLPIFMQNIRHVRQVSSASCHSPDPRVPQVSISSDADTIVRGVAAVHSSDTGHGTRGRCTQTLQHFPWRESSSTLQQHSHPTSEALLMDAGWCVPPLPSHHKAHFDPILNQLEKLEAAKAAWLVCLSLLSLTGSFLVLLGPSGSIFTDLTRPYFAFWALLRLT